MRVRHLTAKVMRDAGVEFETIRQLLGHRSLKTTVNFYAGFDTARAARQHSALIEQKLHEARRVEPRRRSRKVVNPAPIPRPAQKITQRNPQKARPAEPPSGSFAVSFGILLLPLSGCA